MKTKNLAIAIAALLLFAGTSYGIPVQIVRIVQNKTTISNPLQLAELTIIEAGTGTNLAPSGTASQSSTLGGFVASRANDLNFGNFHHTLDLVGGGQTLDVDLGGLFNISDIGIFSRVGCCGQGRTADIQLQLFSDAAGTIMVHDERILGIGTSDSRIITLPVPEPATATLAMLGLGGLMMRRRRNA